MDQGLITYKIRFRQSQVRQRSGCSAGSSLLIGVRRIFPLVYIVPGHNVSMVADLVLDRSFNIVGSLPFYILCGGEFIYPFKCPAEAVDIFIAAFTGNLLLG
jgi:hypothetical protein